MANYILGTLPNFLYPGADCTISGELPNFTGEIAGDQHLNTMTGELPNFTGAIVAHTGRFAAISGDLPNFTGSLVAMSGRLATISGTLPNFTGAISAITNKLAVISGTLPNFTGGISAQFVNVGQILGTLPNFSGSIVSLGTFYILSVNPALRSVTEYSNYSFDSFFEDGGNYYGVNATGIYLLTGTTDAGTAISAYLTSGKGNLGTSTAKAITDAYVMTDINGTMTLNLKPDDTATGKTYSLTGDGTLRNRRWPCALGVTGQDWQWKVSNSAGADFEIRRLELIAARTNRR